MRDFSCPLQSFILYYKKRLSADSELVFTCFFSSYVLLLLATLSTDMILFFQDGSFLFTLLTSIQCSQVDWTHVPEELGCANV